MDKIEQQINEVKVVLKVIKGKRNELKERIKSGCVDREAVKKLRMEDKIIEQVQKMGRLAVSGLELMRYPEGRKSIITSGLMDENPHLLIKELKRFAAGIGRTR